MEKRILVQVSRVVDGLTLYAWKRIGVDDPLDDDSVTFASGGSPGDGLSEPVAASPNDDVENDSFTDVDVNDDVIWLPEGSTGPDTHEAWMMNHSFVGTLPGDKRGRWGVCYTCQEEFPLSEMSKIQGHWYCTKNRCKEDFE